MQILKNAYPLTWLDHHNVSEAKVHWIESALGLIFFYSMYGLICFFTANKFSFRRQKCVFGPKKISFLRKKKMFPAQKKIVFGTK